MASRWTRRLFGGGSTDDPVALRAYDAMVAAFLDMDRRQSVAEAGVTASHELTPQRGLRREWEPVREACYRAAETYLHLSRTEPSDPLAPAPAYEQALQQIGLATRTLDEFYDRHRAHLEHSVAVARTVPQLARQVRTEAQAAAALVTAPEQAAYADYPSVRAAADTLDAEIRALDSAVGTGAVRTAARRAEEAATALRRALAQAPDRAESARKAVASVTTRLSAVRTRAESLAPAFSALLREFNAASSADLAGNERAAREFLDRADADVSAARTAAAANRPEQALELTAAARASLTQAERYVDAVTDRLSVLREVRRDPAAKVEQVRFRLRDAQQLAVQRGLTAEWGSVLDAQLDRIDRAVGSLTGVHPDYWAYVRELDAVSRFIAGVVQRMRGRTDEV
ncbi:hypothetical protein HND73_12885 [Rhodococcus ruber]|uniref:Uncharacterized protein n=2 Tax=Nocardiaceae TaxID=85025 RepID=A0A098BFR1_9NOCA|nr:hypothetical protein [Rhodococcus ruber]CDZ87022.1 conserved hypothetical protein [Rhodococcus ruber]